MSANYLVSVPKLKGRENYSEWAFAAENFLVLEGMSDCIKSETVPAEIGAAAVAVAEEPVKLVLTPAQKQILNEVSWALKLILLKQYQEQAGLRMRRVGMKALVLPGPERRQDEEPEASPSTNDDTDMKMKLFRLMYETVRDSDLKVKRAELINSYYVNSTSFEIGYLMGDVTDKFNVMTDIAATLKRLYDTWRPIEHINAYEQIANEAIETSHLIELVRAISKRDPHNHKTRRFIKAFAK